MGEEIEGEGRAGILFELACYLACRNVDDTDHRIYTATHHSV